MKHKGEILEKAIRESGFKISIIAKRMNKSRQWIYNLFENPNISSDVILEIEKIIRVDISKTIENTSQFNNLQIEDNVEYWKAKYYSLLEEHLELLKRIS